MLELTPEEARVVGSLAEKALATPQHYPLTHNALVNACNQSNNRDPVVSYDTDTVEAALPGLRAKGLARVIHPGGGNRTTKLDETQLIELVMLVGHGHLVSFALNTLDVERQQGVVGFPDH